MAAIKGSNHIVVVGAGIIGSSIAFNLAQRGSQVSVVDASEPGGGASAVSFAWINAREKNPRHYHDLNRRSIDMWDRLARRLGGDVGLTWGGELRWAATPSGAQALAGRIKILQSWGYPIQLLNADELRQIEPELAAGTVVAASYTAIDGHVDAGRVIRACLDKAAERGAKVSTQTTVTELQLTKGDTGVEAVRVGSEQIPCDVLVLAGGPDAPELAALAGLDLPVQNTFGATIVTEPIAPLFRKAAVVHSAIDVDPQIVWRQLPSGSVMIHGGDAATTTGSLGRTEEEVNQVFSAAKRYVPALKSARIAEVRRGRRPVPSDGHPVIGFTQAVPNLYLVSMHSGVTLAPLVGEFAAAEILDVVRIDLLEPYRFERFQTGPN